MPPLLLTFKAISLIFTAASRFTGFQALMDPIAFSTSFGLPIKPTKPGQRVNDTTRAYISLMGVRQLATGLTLLAFAYQGKWKEIATVLRILGIVVAGTDGVFLTQEEPR